MDPLVHAGSPIHKVEHPLRQRPTARHLAQHLPRTTTVGVAPVPAAVHKHALPAAVGRAVLPQRAPRQVQVHVRRLQQVVIHLVEVGDGPDDVGAHVALVRKRLEAAPYAHVGVELVLVCVAVVCLVRVDPLLDFNLARAVVDFQRHVGGLRVDVADLADKGDLGYGRVVDFEVGAGEGLVCFEDLLDGYGAEGFILV